MKNIKFLINKNKIDKKILSDLKNLKIFIGEIKLQYCQMFIKKGEMSPTGCVLSSDLITPSFTHLSVGSGTSTWMIKSEKIYQKLN